MRLRTNRPPWIETQPRVQQEYEANRSRTVNRQLYLTPQWKQLRTIFLAEHPVCSVPGCGKPATVVDHVLAHRGEEAMFFDTTNMQALCKRHHDQKTARHDGGFGRTRTPPEAA